MVDVIAAIESVSRRVEPLALKAAMRVPARLRRLVAGRPVRLDGQTLDPEMATVLRIQRLAGVPSVEALPIPAGRALLRDRSHLLSGTQPVGHTRDLPVPGGEAQVPARLYVPRGAAEMSPLLLFVHGGGWVYGDLDSHDGLCRYLAERSGVRVLSVDYRRAPEHRHPAALDDCLAAYRWLLKHAADLGGDPARLAVAGDSAGGHLAAALCLRAGEEELPQPVAQLLVYPATDFSQRLPSRDTFAEGFALNRGFMDRCEAAYLTPGADTTDPLLSPLQAKDLSGLAPAYVVTAGFDPLRDEGEAFARRVADDGGRVELERHPGLIHGFARMVGVSPAARAAVDEVAARLARL